MASKGQCLNCKGYNPKSDLCTIKWVQPEYDGTTCESAQNKNRVTLFRHQDKFEQTSSKNEHTDLSEKRIRKRGKSFTKNSLHIKNHDVSNSDNFEKSAPFVISIPESALRNIGIFLFFLLICSLAYGAYFYIEHRKEQKIEDLVWKARCELELVRNDKIIDYLKVNKIEYENRQLRLSIIRNSNTLTDEKNYTDSIICKELTSLVAVAPNRWDTIAKYLIEAQVDLVVTYQNVHLRPSVTIPYGELIDRLLKEEKKKAGLNMFAMIKGQEIMKYASIHFNNDILLRVDSLSVSDQFLRLCLSYDDTKAKLGKSFLNKDRINLHYLDPVGDMGSILDGMLSICTRTNKGFGFVYTARKSGQVDSCEWDAGIAQEIAKANNQGILTSGRKTNQVRTIITKQR